MTVPEIVVDISPAKGRFKDGQAYVAFSRVTSLDKLHIINYTCEQIRVSKNVDEMNREDKNMLPMLPEPMISQIDSQTNVKLLHLNICGIACKFFDVKCDKLLRYADVLCFNETHLCSQDSVTSEMLGFDDTYVIFRQDRNEYGSGVMVVVRKHLKPRHILTASNMEVIVIQIDTQVGLLYVMSVYRSPKYTSNSWITEIKHLPCLYKDKKSLCDRRCE